MSKIIALKKNYGDFLVDIPEWVIADEGVTVLRGPSGSGKSSVVRLLLGLEDCPGLSWKLGEVDIAELPIQQRNLGVVFQNYDLFPHMTAKENIIFAALARKLSHDQFEKRLADFIAELQLDKCLDRKAAVLSGGERQRVALARALIGRPRFLFLDEPFAALDADLRDDARRLVRRIIQKENIPTLLITHDPSDVTALADHIVEIRSGRLVK